jgi:hypothetical protein
MFLSISTQTHGMSKIKSYVYEELLTRYERVTSLARLTTKRNMLIACIMMA